MYGNNGDWGKQVEIEPDYEKEKEKRKTKKKRRENIVCPDITCDIHRCKTVLRAAC